MAVEGRRRDLRALPKAHLHVHLEAAMRWTTLRDLGFGSHQRNSPGRGWKALERIYRATCAALNSTDAFDRLLREFVRDNAAEGAVWVEPPLYPPVHRRLFGSDAAAVTYIGAQLQRACAESGIAGGLMVTADRRRSPGEALTLAETAAHFAASRQVVAFGLAGVETGYPAAPFRRAFGIARDAGLLVTPHAGEMAGPPSVRDAIDAAAPDRIQHGFRAIEDPAIVAELAESGTVLDICLESNRSLGFVDSLADHPLTDLLGAGVRCSLNADDPIAFGSSLLHEYEVARNELGIDDRALAGVAVSSIVGSGAADDIKQIATAEVRRWLEGNQERGDQAR